MPNNRHRARGKARKDNAIRIIRRQGLKKLKMSRRIKKRAKKLAEDFDRLFGALDARGNMQIEKAYMQKKYGTPLMQAAHQAHMSMLLSGEAVTMKFKGKDRRGVEWTVEKNIDLDDIRPIQHNKSLDGLDLYAYTKACKLPHIAIMGEPTSLPMYMRATMASVKSGERLVFDNLPKPAKVDGETYQDIAEWASRHKLTANEISDRIMRAPKRFILSRQANHFVSPTDIKTIMKDEVDKDNENNQ